MSSQSLSEADRSFENQLPSVFLHTDKVTYFLTNWPVADNMTYFSIRRYEQLLTVVQLQLVAPQRSESNKSSF